MSEIKYPIEFTDDVIWNFNNYVDNTITREDLINSLKELLMSFGRDSYTDVILYGLGISYNPDENLIIPESQISSIECRKKLAERVNIHSPEEYSQENHRINIENKKLTDAYYKQKCITNLNKITEEYELEKQKLDNLMSGKKMLCDENIIMYNTLQKKLTILASRKQDLETNLITVLCNKSMGTNF